MKRGGGLELFEGLGDTVKWHADDSGGDGEGGEENDGPHLFGSVARVEFSRSNDYAKSSRTRDALTFHIATNAA